jgi:hypothetical protein
LDNLCIERFWKTIRFDHIYLHPAMIVLNFLMEFKTFSANTTKNFTGP